MSNPKPYEGHTQQGGALYVQFSEALLDRHETIRKWSRHPFDGAIRFDETRVNKGPAADAMYSALDRVMNRHASNVLFHDKSLAEECWEALAAYREQSNG